MLALDTSTNNFAPEQNPSPGKVLHAQDIFENKKTKDHSENTFANLEKLKTMLASPENNSSLACMEGVDKESDTKKINKDQYIKIFRDYVPMAGLALASFMHIAAGFSQATKMLPESLSNFFDKQSLKVSKFANLYNYTAKGVMALKNGRSWDGIARLAYWIAAFANLENFFLFSGISSGISMMEQGHIDKVKKSGKNNLLEDFTSNSKAFIEKIKEVFKAGIGKDRIVFRGRKMEEKHKGTMFVSAFGNFFGAALGLIAPQKDSKLRKLAAIVRNLGSLGCDWGKLLHPDPNNRNSAFSYLVVSVFDLVQTFAKEPVATMLSHFGLATNNLANFYYVNTSKARDEQTYLANAI